MSHHHIINKMLTARMTIAISLIALADLSVVATATQVQAWIDEHRGDISGELGEVEWERIAHIGWDTGDGSGVHYTGSTLTQTDSVVHALRARSKGVERCSGVLIDTDWDVEWEASNSWATGGSEDGWGQVGACGNSPWLQYTVSNNAEHRAWLSDGSMEGGEHSAWVEIPTFSPPSW